MAHRERRGGGSLPAKPLFAVDEKVLCYEPDLKKARVLYDSKVLEVVRKKDANGFYREYKIHFQGWKDTWDRYVREENVLKDTDENRDLQTRLYESAQLNKNAGKNKKKKKTIREKLQAAAAAQPGKDGSANGLLEGSIKGLKRKEGNGNLSDSDTSDGDSSEGEQPMEPAAIYLPDTLKRLLDKDFYHTKKNEWLLRLPARKTVVSYLEDYMRHSARQEIKAYMQKMGKIPADATSTSSAPSTPTGKLQGNAASRVTGRSATDIANEELMKTFRKIAYSKKLVEDIRIMFDFLLYQVCLYSHEGRQYKEFLKGDFNSADLLNGGLIEQFIQRGFKQETPPLILKKAAKARARAALKLEQGLGGIEISGPSTSVSIVSPGRKSAEPTKEQRQKDIIDAKTMPPPPPPPPLKSKLKSFARPAPIPQKIVASCSGSVKPAEQPKKKEGPQMVFKKSKGATGPVMVIPKLKVPMKMKNRTGQQEKEGPAEKRRKMERRGKIVASVNKSQKPVDTQNPNAHKHRRCSMQGRCRFPWACEQLNGFMDEMVNYKMLPTEEAEGENIYPSLCYGLCHLLRLFVKLPSVLAKSCIPRKKLNVVTAEVNSILRYLSSFTGNINDADWFDPSVRMYEEDFINEQTCHLFGSAEVNAFRRTGSRSSRFRRLGEPSATRATPEEEEISLSIGEGSSRPSSPRKTRASSNKRTASVAKGLAKVTVSTTRVRRMSGRRSAPMFIEGNALGVRKSLSQEELSRETLVAASSSSSSSATIAPAPAVTPSPAPARPAVTPSPPKCKSYSLRTHCRIPYK